MIATRSKRAASPEPAPAGDHDAAAYLTLAQAARVAPGRPSPNCIWRWCRRGVLARSGQRVRLEHVRVGGRVFTTRGWVEQFGRALAAADVAYFDENLEESRGPATGEATGDRPEFHHSQAVLDAASEAGHVPDDIERELEEEGL